MKVKIPKVFFNLQRKQLPQWGKSMTSVCPAKRKVNKSNRNHNILVLKLASLSLLRISFYFLLPSSQCLGFLGPSLLYTLFIPSPRQGREILVNVRNFLINWMLAEIDFRKYQLIYYLTFKPLVSNCGIKDFGTPLKECLASQIRFCFSFEGRWW